MLDAFLTPNKRLYPPFIGGALLLATMVWCVRWRHVPLTKWLFPKRIWLHPSTLLDLRIAIFRTLLEGVLIVPFAIPVSAAAVSLARVLWSHLGLAPELDASRATVTVLFSLAAFCAEDFGRYVVHRLAHEIGPLWELHKVHHSAEVMTPLTVYRTHPLESVLMRAGAAGSLTLVAAIFIWLFPGRVAAWEIGGVYALSFWWTALGANLRHSHVWLPYPAWLERIVISPAQHQIHHAVDPRLHHSNYGSALAIWDWLGGTLRFSGRQRVRVFGLPAEQQNHAATVRSVLWHPLRRAVRRLAG